MLKLLLFWVFPNEFDIITSEQAVFIDSVFVTVLSKLILVTQGVLDGTQNHTVKP